VTESNRPKKGDNITVEPIRERKDIEAIKQLTKGNPRDYLLFVLGINNGLRISDMLKLKAGMMRDLKAGDSLQIKEQKTGKHNVLVVNKAVHAALKLYFETYQPEDDDYLFKSRKGKNNPLSASTVGNYVKGWCRTLKLKGNFGARTLRKTWGYQARIHHGAGLDLICKRFNHSSPAVTLRYLGITDKQINDLLMFEN
jgi:integrase